MKLRRYRMPELLLEIGCEEIPARMIQEGLKILRIIVQDSLKPHKLLPPDYDDAKEVLDFCTPRRISIYFPRVIAQQSDGEEQLVGPALKIAFKDGHPTQAAEA